MAEEIRRGGPVKITGEKIMNTSTLARSLGKAGSTRQRIAAFAIAGALVAAVSGCSQVAVAPPGNCHPEYSVGGAEGGLNVRQAGKGQAIAWGIYVSADYKVGTEWTVNVYAGGVKIDGKKQAYEPHGSIGAAKALKYSGKTLEISGTAVHDKDDVLKFDGKCTIA